MNVFEGFIAQWKEKITAGDASPAPGIAVISGTARPVPTADYSVSVAIKDAVFVRVCLSSQQVVDLAIRLQTLKDLGQITDWTIGQLTDLSLSELLGWIISMGDDSESLEEL